MLKPHLRVPEGHPLRRLLRDLTATSFEAVGAYDRELVSYVSEMLVDFVHIDNLYRISARTGRRMEYVVDLLMEASEPGPIPEREVRKHIGDYCLFFTGLYPESLAGRSVGPDYYVEQGRSAYRKVSLFDEPHPSAALFKRLSDKFEFCVQALNAEKSFLQDPFYRYLMRQMGY
ncbi:MAG: hypothetical protein ACE5LX_03965 [Nitrospinota bacterium]